MNLVCPYSAVPWCMIGKCWTVVDIGSMIFLMDQETANRKLVAVLRETADAVKERQSATHWHAWSSVLVSTLGLFLGMAGSLVSSASTFSAVATSFKESLWLGIIIVVAASGLVALATFIVKRLQERDAPVDEIRATIESAYLHALAESKLNPRATTGQTHARNPA